MGKDLARWISFYSDEEFNTALNREANKYSMVNQKAITTQNQLENIHEDIKITPGQVKGKYLLLLVFRNIWESFSNSCDSK